MNVNLLKPGMVMLLFAVGLSVASCKSKEKKAEEAPAVDTTTTMPSTDNTAVTPEIATDDSLTVGVKDAVKDFPGVTATVSNGEVTLEGGPVTRDQLQKLMQSVNSLHPKKVNNKLTIQK